MEIKIHRGENQIGGSIVEVATQNTRILLDVGLEMEETTLPILPNIKGLFDSAEFDAVLISHYHMDHMGLAPYIHNNIPLYMGQKGYEIVKAIAKYNGREIGFRCETFLSGNTFCIGDIKVTPLLVDHSAFDSYMFLLEADNKSILYTGDFRSNGRKSFEYFLQKLPTDIDVLICEGTTLTRDDKINIREKELEEQVNELMLKKTGPIFILQAATNIDRLVTMYRASKRNNRLFLEDLYMAEVARAAGSTIPNPMNFEDVRVFITRPYDKEHFRYKMLDAYGKKKIGKRSIVKQNFTMNIRSSMLLYLESLHVDMDFSAGALIYSMWEGYRDQEQMQQFLLACEGLGLETTSIHTSGHADSTAIRKLVNTVNPKEIMPIHTENAEWFSQFM